MPRTKKILHVPDTDDLKQFLKLARAIWRQAHPESKKNLGRPSQEAIDFQAIKSIATRNAGISMGKFALWSQSEWVSAIGHHKMESFPGKATLKKNLKKALTNRNLLFPLQQIPASIVRQKPVPEQLEHWFSVAFVVALTTTDTAVSGKTSISHKAIDDAHRKLCRKHMLKKDQPTEKNRQRWLLNKCHGLQQVSIHSSK